MLKILLTAFLVIGTLLSAARAQKVEKVKIRSGDKNRSCYIFVPEKPETGSLPMIVLLHGSNNNGMSQADKWKSLAKAERFIIAAPDSSNSASWQVPQDGPDFIRDVVEHMAENYPVDRRRVYVFGHSAGAIMALSLAVMESEYFAAVAAHAGLLPQQMGDLVPTAKRKIPISLLVGTRDPLFPVDKVVATQSFLTRHGFDVDLTKISGHDHNYYGLSKEINEMVWTQLKTRKLNADPVYETYQFK